MEFCVGPNTLKKFGLAYRLNPGHPNETPALYPQLHELTLFFSRYSINKTREDEVRAYNEKMKPIWDAEKAAAAAVANREQLLYLAKETGTKVRPVPEGHNYSRIFFKKNSPKQLAKISYLSQNIAF
jgi:hypothetical protein